VNVSGPEKPRHLDLFSGAGGFTLGFDAAGYETVAFSEIEPFPCSILRHRYPDIPNLGDVTRVKGDQVGRVDVITAGFPCQDLSVAGKRGGLAGSRSGLFWEVVRLARETRAPWVVLENVPGLLSSNGGRDFAVVLNALDELGYGLSWAVLDAQHFGVPQRRRRVFVVGRLGAPCPPEILFEPEGVRGDLAAYGEAGQGPTPLLEVGARTNGDGYRDGDGIGKPGDPMYTLQAGKHHGITQGVAGTLNSRGNRSHTELDGHGAYVPEVSAALAGSTRWDAETETFIPLAFDTTQVTSDKNYSNPKPGDPCHPLASGAHPPAVAFAENQRAEVRTSEVHPQLTAGGGKPGQGYPAVAFATQQTPKGWDMERGTSPTLQEPSPSGGGQPHTVMAGMAVRRLTPLECERLMGWPDGWTDVPHRGKPAADGPRYRACGNGVVAPVVEYIARRMLPFVLETSRPV
jgi:DNA (cytosine-5)-methyltransferase 1